MSFDNAMSLNNVMSADLAATRLASSGPIDLGVLPSELDGGLASRAAIGLVVLATDQTLEHEFRALVRQSGVAFYRSRVFSDNDITTETLRAIGPRIAPAVDLILPSIPLDVVAFGCTSATMTLGEEAVFAEIRKARPNVACTTPVTAALAAFKALDVKGIGLLTPYAPQINENLVAYFSGRGVDISAVATFDRRDDRDAARISATSIEAAAERMAATPGWMRSSYHAPACASPKRPPGSSSASACRSRPATTPWPGIVCGLPGSMTSCPPEGFLDCQATDWRSRRTALRWRDGLTRHEIFPLFFARRCSRVPASVSASDWADPLLPRPVSTGQGRDA